MTLLLHITEFVSVKKSEMGIVLNTKSEIYT